MGLSRYFLFTVECCLPVYITRRLRAKGFKDHDFPSFVDRKTWPRGMKCPSQGHGAGGLVLCFQGTVGLEVRGDLYHSRDPLGSLPLGLESNAGGMPPEEEAWHCEAGIRARACAQGWWGEERLLIIYIHSGSSLGENNPNRLSKDVLDLIPRSEAAP